MASLQSLSQLHGLVSTITNTVPSSTRKHTGTALPLTIPTHPPTKKTNTPTGDFTHDSIVRNDVLVAPESSKALLLRKFLMINAWHHGGRPSAIWDSNYYCSPNTATLVSELKRTSKQRIVVPVLAHTLVRKASLARKRPISFKIQHSRGSIAGKVDFSYKLMEIPLKGGFIDDKVDLDPGLFRLRA
ncbi:hypothetical protein D9611_009560 [Ephemerocybe angulata]|uniref:Uncharacterized protein n=1 Tax=Ephemerocybe angulata TaxID=980116 RepID=A0A8H5AWV3_9AGAR|nr:hypothetical protein D9611_009560 [Tulosesus angulatus]